jgi:hypothetical protein
VEFSLHHNHFKTDNCKDIQNLPEKTSYQKMAACDQQTISLQELQTTLIHAENQFRKACNQIVLLNMKLCACSVRYRRAKANNMRTFRYPLRLRLAVVEGVRNMYYDYATRKAQQIEQVREIISELVGHVIVIDSDDEI